MTQISCSRSPCSARGLKPSPPDVDEEFVAEFNLPVSELLPGAERSCEEAEEFLQGGTVIPHPLVVDVQDCVVQSMSPTQTHNLQQRENTEWGV